MTLHFIILLERRKTKVCKELAIVSISNNGLKIAKKILSLIDGDLYCLSKYAKDDCVKFENLSEITERIFKEYKALVYIMATGIVVRSIAKVLNNKFSDPAVIVIDDGGNFVVSLLSGHFGGANELTLRLAKILNATAVITTATDVHNKFAIDVYMKKYGMLVNNYKLLKDFSVSVLNDNSMRIYIDEELEEFEFSRELTERLSKAVFDRFFQEYDLSITFRDYVHSKLILYPKVLHVGLGFTSKVSYEDLLNKINYIFKKNKLSLKSLKTISSIDRKAESESFKHLISYMNKKYLVNAISYRVEDIKPYEDKFPTSDFVRRTVGVGSVARPCAYLSSNKGKELFYEKFEGITVSVFLENPKGESW